MSEDTPDNVELHHFENVFQGNMSPNPLALFSQKLYPHVLNMDLRPSTRNKLEIIRSIFRQCNYHYFFAGEIIIFTL